MRRVPGPGHRPAPHRGHRHTERVRGDRRDGDRGVRHSGIHAGWPPGGLQPRLAGGPRAARRRGPAHRGRQAAMAGGGPGGRRTRARAGNAARRRHCRRGRRPGTDPVSRGRLGQLPRRRRGAGGVPRRRGQARVHAAARRARHAGNRPARGRHVRVRARDELREAVRRAGRRRPGEPGVHQPRDPAAHRQPLPRPGAHPAAAALPARRQPRRGHRRGRRLRRRRGAAPGGSGVVRRADRHPVAVRVRRRGDRAERPGAADRAHPGRADHRGTAQQPVDGTAPAAL